MFQLVYDIQEHVDLRAFFNRILKKGETRNIIVKWLKGMKDWDRKSFPKTGRLGYDKFKKTIIESLV